MPELSNKTILVISPQSWGNMFVAKHHYAIELAKLGNEVYFLNPPDNNKWKLAGRSKRIRLEKSSITPSLKLIWHELYFPFILKFHAKKIFDLLMKKQIKDILGVIGKPVDIIWSFDLGNLYPLSNFQAAYKIFHPVDEPQNAEAYKAAENADILFAVTPEILEKYSQYSIPKYHINHGVSEFFFHHSAIARKGKVKVGISGNLLRSDIDRDILLQIVNENPDIIFEIWGSYEAGKTNLGGETAGPSTVFVQALKKAQNVVLHGAVLSRELPDAINKMDAFLICYDVEKDQSKGTNYHKIMEYLSTGKVIISNNVTNYQSEPILIQMVRERTHNNNLPSLFKKVINELEKQNSEEYRQYRISFAKNNTYTRQIEKIRSIVEAS